MADDRIHGHSGACHCWQHHSTPLHGQRGTRHQRDFSPLTSVLEPLYDLAGQVLELFAVIVSALIGFIAWFIQRSTSSSNSGGGGTHYTRDDFHG